VLACLLNRERRDLHNDAVPVCEIAQRQACGAGYRFTDIETAHNPRHTYDAGPGSAHDPRTTYDSGLTYDPRRVYNSPTYGGSTYESPVYNSSPSHDTGQPGPGADYSTVIGYPGPAADYRAPKVPQAPQPDSPEPRRDDEGYSDGYGDPRFGDSRFPF